MADGSGRNWRWDLARRVLHWHTLRDQRHSGPRRSSNGLGRGGKSMASSAASTVEIPGRTSRTGLYDPDIHARDDSRRRSPSASMPATARRNVYKQRSGRELAALGHQGKMAAALCPRHGGQGPMIPACCSPGVAKPRRVKRGTCSAPPTSGRVGETPAAPHPAQRHCMGPCHASRRRQPHRGVQPVRRSVRHRGCRRVLAQDRA